MTSIHKCRRLFAAAGLAGAALLSGCAALNNVSSSVATYGAWPADRTPGTYAFDRLPSQQSNLKRQEALESAAADALGAAGFRPVADGAKPAVTVQVGARIERFEVSPWDDPFWTPGFRHGYRRWGGPWGPYGFGGPWDWGPQPDQYQREVALLIRDAESGKPLYETRASNGGLSEGGQRLLAAMFQASLKDFPRANEKAHDVTVPMSMVPSAAPSAGAASAPAAS